MFSLFTALSFLVVSSSTKQIEKVEDYLLPTPQKISILPKKPEASKRSLAFKDGQGHYGKEGYRLNITDQEILIFSDESAGKFYAQQTLKQLHNHYGDLLPNLDIVDAPKFAWRGLHLDVSRHFFTVEEVKKMLELMAYYKFNRLHFHLTDGPGWRLEIKKYPRLTEVGAWRADKTDREWNWRETEISPNGLYKQKRYGGFYTQEEIKELVRFAEERHILIVPEIEMPGHSFAAMMAYPELVCEGNHLKVDGLRGKDMVCVGKESTKIFFINILSEVLELFPHSPIHIGGDEVMHQAWLTCPHCQARMKKEKLKSSEDLQTAFMKDIIHFLKQKKRTIIAWDEIYEGGLSDSQVATMVWRGLDLGYQAAQKGPVILCPGEWCYFDMYQGDPKTEPKAIGGNIPLEKVNQFSPLLPTHSPQVQQNIIGIQANIWTEYMTTMSHVEYMTWPRAMVIAEIAWRGKPSPLSQLNTQISHQLPFLQKNKYNFRPLRQ